MDRRDLIERELGESFEDLENDDVAEMVLHFEQLHARVQALQSEAIAELIRRRCVNRRRHRNERLWLSSTLRLPARTVGHRFNRAALLDGILAPAADLLHAGRIAPQHVDELAKLAADKRLIETLERDLDVLLGWARTEPWPIYVRLLEGWAQMMDDTDPETADERTFDRRGIAWAQGLDGAILAEIDTTAIIWEQWLSAARPIYDRMLEQDWAAAKAEHGDRARGSHLTRTDRQRWHDAAFEVIRHGIANLQSGRPAATPRFDVGITVDLDTIENEARRQAGQPTQPRTADDAHHFRCTTEHGLRLSSRTALFAAVAGTIRRVTLDLPNLDFAVSKSTRLFRGELRKGLIIRDGVCAHPGCQTPAHRCQADHIIPYQHGGPTTPANGQMLCPPCHRHKTRLEAEGLLPRAGPEPSFTATPRPGSWPSIVGSWTTSTSLPPCSPS